MSNLNSKELLALVESGDNRAAKAVFDRYVARLLALVRERIGPKLGRRIDADDVVQSTYRSFFVHAENGDYRLTNAGDLWRLLASIALHKLHGQVEKHTAARRNIQREDAGTDAANNLAATLEPTAAEVVAITEQLQLISKRLTAEQRTVLFAHLQGDSAETIPTTLQKSPRTVRRHLAEARQLFEYQLVADAEGHNRIDEQTRRELDARAPLAYGDYVLERLVGAGGMGKVYRATNRNTGQPVAIKTLHKSRQRDHRAVEKFLQEADVLAKLNHPNIIALHGVGRYPGGGYFLVMDFIDGADLESRLARRPLEVAEALRIVRTVASAIGHAHSHGIVHGDVKPANILLDTTNRVVVSDFGLAQFIDTSPNSPHWLIGGTPGYVAPEVLSGNSLPSRFSDIYSLGALLAALCAVNPATVLDYMDHERESAMRLSSISAKCLMPNPRARYQSIDELVEEMDCTCN